MNDIEGKLIEMVNPQKIGGKNGFEGKYVDDFEKTVFYLSQHMRNPKESTVREFFTVFYEVKKSAEKQMMEAKNPRRKVR